MSVIITATGADVKLANRLLLYLKDWQNEAGYIYSILRTLKDADTITADNRRDEVPLQSFPVNEWEGLSIPQVERIMTQKCDAVGSTHLFLLLDDQGVREQTIIVSERASNYVDNTMRYLRKYNKVRVPWEDASSMWCNLWIANMDFWDFCLEDDHNETADHWAEYGFERNEDDKGVQRAETVIRQLKKLDLT